MKRAGCAFVSLVTLLLVSSLAQAQAFRAYVASYGSDTNPCAVTAPCRLIPAALAAVAPGGEIWILDSANFNSGTVNIDKSVTIMAVPGAVGSIVAVHGGSAIDITTAGVNVVLRNLVIANNAVSPGTYGLHVTNAQSVTLDHCAVQGVPQQGILAGGNAMTVYVKDSEIRQVGNVAIEANDGVILDVVRTKMSDNYYNGLYAHPLNASGTAQITVTDSQIAGSWNGTNGAGVGLFANAAATGSSAKIYADRVSISNVASGLVTSGPGTASIEIGNSMVVKNGYNVFISTGTIRSLGNNNISDPVNADAGSLTTLTPR